MKNILTTLIFILISTMCFSQSIGFRVGVDRAKMMLIEDNTELTEVQMKNQFHAGLIAEYPFTKNFSIELGASVANRGYDYNNNFSETKFVAGPYGYSEVFVRTIDERELKLLYIDLPISFKIAKPVESGKIFLSIGGYYSRGISGKHSVTQGQYSGIQTRTLPAETTNVWDDLQKDLLKSDYGLRVGAGVDIHAFTFNFSYNLGLAEISNDSPNYLYSQMKNRSINVSVGLNIGK